MEKAVKLFTNGLKKTLITFLIMLGTCLLAIGLFIFTVVQLVF